MRHGSLRCWQAILFGFCLGAGWAWAGNGAPTNPQRIVLYDARALWQLDVVRPEEATRLWDTWHVLAALQGLANREAPHLYVLYCRHFGVETDQFWWDWYRGESGWLADASVEEAEDIEALLVRFREAYDGLVVYDPQVPATSNAASTAAGVERWLPIRFDPTPGSLFTFLREKLQVPVRLWLVNEDGTPRFTGKGRIPDLDQPSSGSAKIDAYRWAVGRYLQPGRCHPDMAAYYIDAFWLQVARHGPADLHTLSNHDYFIANRAFFFDLSAWADETPNDDPGQVLGADRDMLLNILRRLNALGGERVIKIGGFTPWPFKYTDARGVGGRHGGVPTEWEFSRLISEYNAYVEADAAGLSSMANASFHQHFPLAARYPQPNPRPTTEDWRARGLVSTNGTVTPKLYVGHYVGDYDAPSWLYKAVPAFFQDPARGSVPLGWAFNPNLADRAPQALVYSRRHATTNDFFIAGDSGAGYLNPRALTIRKDSDLPSGLKAWVAHNQRYFAQWDLDITGFVLDGAGGASTGLEYAAYARFSPAGLGTHFEKGPAIYAGVPTCPEQDLPDDVDAAAGRLAAYGRQHAGEASFFWARSILKSPAWYRELSERLRSRHPNLTFEVVDPYTFFGLIRVSLETPSQPDAGPR